jgi:hypothetical protein
MKSLITHFLYAFVFCLSAFSGYAQQPIVPLSGYGVWDRANEKDARDPRYNYLLGIRAEAKWAEVQPNDSTAFNWILLLDVLKKADSTNQFVKLNIFVGPDCPDWIYSNGVPAVQTNDKDHPNWTRYPYYLDEDYKRHFYRLIKEFSLFLKGLPEHLLKHVCFVQVMTGCTGDEEAYKGDPLTTSSAYKISVEQWREFRLETFAKFVLHFNQGNGRKIGLLFNNVDPAKELLEWQWVNNNIDPNIGFGIKGSAYMRGHHLTDELSFKKSFFPFLVNPLGMKLFSAAEMDQSWTKPLYQINVPLGFYWGMLGGLNTGLSIWDVSGTAMNYADNSVPVQNAFRFFNKHAPQIYPATTTAAYSIFHEGLNAADTIKFPITKYGKANKNNLDRYTAICNDPIYKSHGARMDDLPSAALGQVAQRDKQTGYNDAGWDIQDGNYERWITQLKPDSTSIGLFRVRGTIDSTSSIYDRFARSFESKSGKNTMFFQFDPNVFSLSKPKSLKFSITWLDKNAGSKWALKYYNDKGLQTALVKTGTGDNQWKKDTITITDANVARIGLNGSDFLLVNEDSIDDIFHGIEVDIERNFSTVSAYDPGEIEFKVFPNPTHSVISWANSVVMDELIVYDTNGAIVMTANPTQHSSIDLLRLRGGMYFISFYYQKKYIQTVKVIKL